MPITFFCFCICAAALAGLPLFSGFQSKDAILISIFDWSGDMQWRQVFAWTMVLTSILTIFYTVRMVWFVFFDDAKKTALLTIQEVPTIMRIPLVLLSLGSLWWMVAFHPLDFSGWLLDSVQPNLDHDLFITWLSLISIPTITVLAILWFKKRKKPRTLGFLQEGYYLDYLNSQLVMKPVLKMSAVSERIDKRGLDGIIHGFAYLTVGLAHLLAWIDTTIVDGLVDTSARLARGLGSIARAFSGGQIQSYIFWSVFALVISLFWFLF